MKARTWILLVLCVVGVLVAGCSGARVDTADLEGTWRLEAFGVEKSLMPIESVKSEIKLEDGEATGNGGTNSFGGTYKADSDGSLVFSDITSTLMAGSPEADQQEAAFFKALNDTRRFEIAEGKLVLSDKGNNTLAVLVRR